jgi:hypothetical protein
MRSRFPWLQPISADGGDNSRQAEAAVGRVPALRAWKYADDPASTCLSVDRSAAW